jgi:hypothetical protein
MQGQLPEGGIMKAFIWSIFVLLTAGLGAAVFFFYKRLQEDEAAA